MHDVKPNNLFVLSGALPLYNFHMHAQAAKDYRTDADLHAACEPDAKQLCSDTNPGQGRIQVCPAH